MNNNNDSSSMHNCPYDIQPTTPPPPNHGGVFPTSDVIQETTSSSVDMRLGIINFHHQNYHQQPSLKRKRTKLIKLSSSPSTSSSMKPKNVSRSYKKSAAAAAAVVGTDPSAPKITRPCSECGKKFWSWKALFGHMRCHPERQWRGINPPANLVRRHDSDDEDHEVAACLLMLANGNPSVAATGSSQVATTSYGENIVVMRDDNIIGGDDYYYGFECSSCKKVFGSRQALGGHRASHKNVKGCFAITRSTGEGDDLEEVVEEVEEVRIIGGDDQEGGGGGGGGHHIHHHQCSICLRVFSSGQALGGHKRCHWEKVDDQPASTGGGGGGGGGVLDLNLPAPVDNDDLHTNTYSSGGLELDLRLGL